MKYNRKVCAYLKRPAEELYDIQNDPDELNNLAKLPQYQDTLRMMREKVKQFRKETSDPWLINDKYVDDKELYSPGQIGKWHL